jgi:hypothetical protein
MEVRVSGLDEVLQGLEDLKRAVSAETFVEWADRIQETAKANCGESVVFEGSIDSQGRFSLKRSANPDSFDCLTDAINQHLSSMHPATRPLFERVIYDMMAEKAKTPTPVQSG